MTLGLFWHKGFAWKYGKRACLVIQWAAEEVYESVIKDPRYSSETRTVNLLERWSEEVCARIKWEAPVVQETSRREQQPQPVKKKKVIFVHKVTESKEDSERTEEEEDEVAITKTVRRQRVAKKPKTEEEEKPKVKPEKPSKSPKSSSVAGLGNFFFC